MPLVTVKECAAELNVSPALVLELLRHGMLPGSKRGRLWRVDGDDLSAVRGALAAMRGASQPDHDPQCWSWLHEPDVDLSPSRPWSAPMPSSTGAWLGRQDLSTPAFHDGPLHGFGSLPAFTPEAVPAPAESPHEEPSPAEEAIQRARVTPRSEIFLPTVAPPPPSAEREPAPACPVCGEPTASRLVDADLGEQWFCSVCDCLVQRVHNAYGPTRTTGSLQHAADYDRIHR